MTASKDFYADIFIIIIIIQSQTFVYLRFENFGINNAQIEMWS